MRPILTPLLALVALLGAGLAAPPEPGAATTITGAGATFPYPIYGRWAYAYQKQTGVQLNYQSIGSGGGVKQIKARTVDFGASDAPLKPAELEKHGLIQFPMIMGGVVPVVHIQGVGPGQLRLDGATLAAIYLGEVHRWNDPRIQALNPGVTLPDRGITVVHRADGSGTTWIFTNYLTKVSEAWGKEVGNAKAVSWPVGLGGKGNEGVAAFVKRIDGAIGYVEYAYALQNHMAHCLLKNHDGRFVAPTAKAFQAAAAGADWAHADHYYLVLTDQPGERSWPITGASFILMYERQARPERARAVLRFLDWSYRNGGAQALRLDYVPMPEAVVRMVEATWGARIRGPKGEALWPAR